MKRIVILGSTGSIGKQTLDVIRNNPDQFQVVGLSAASNSQLLFSQAREFDVSTIALLEEKGTFDAPDNCTVLFGADNIVSLVELEDVDLVVNALVGSAGLRASYRTLELGRTLALANKESLVVGGDLLIPKAKLIEKTYKKSPSIQPYHSLLPIDSEHGAIFQCLVGESRNNVKKLWITASGGPFLHKKKKDLLSITPAEALKHPTWSMGKKISIDSSTLMNKGLEVIEAHHLFGIDYDDIKVVVQPQSVIHSMVEFIDGSVIAHLGTTDMRIPIQYALSYPKRLEAPVRPLDFTTLGHLNFDAPDLNTFSCLRLAFEAGRRGGTLPCVLNAANEVAVDAFLHERLSYLGIPQCIEAIMERHDPEDVRSIDQLLEIDSLVRLQAQAWIEKITL